MIANLITDPRAFIRERTKYRGTKTQAIIAIVVGFAFALQHVASYFQLDDEIAIELYEVLVIQFTINMLVPFGIWLAATVLIAVVGRVVVDSFRTGDVFRLSGWGLLPLVASGLLQSAGRSFAVRDAEQPDLGMFSHLSFEWDQYLLYLESANGELVFVAALILAALLVLYSGYIWTIVVQELGEMEGNDVDTGAAALVAGLPTLLCLGWVLSPLFL